MLRRMMGIKRIEKIRNEEIRARAGVTNINETIREERQMVTHVLLERKTGRWSNEKMEDGSKWAGQIERLKLSWR